MSSASLNRARGVNAALAWDTKASWLMKRFLDSSTSQPEAFPVTQAHRYKPGQPPWTSHLAEYDTGATSSCAAVSEQHPSCSPLRLAAMNAADGLDVRICAAVGSVR